MSTDVRACYLVNLGTFAGMIPGGRFLLYEKITFGADQVQ